MIAMISIDKQHISSDNHHLRKTTCCTQCGSVEFFWYSKWSSNETVLPHVKLLQYQVWMSVYGITKIWIFYNQPSSPRSTMICCSWSSTAGTGSIPYLPAGKNQVGCRWSCCCFCVNSDWLLIQVLYDYVSNLWKCMDMMNIVDWKCSCDLYPFDLSIWPSTCAFNSSSVKSHHVRASHLHL